LPALRRQRATAVWDVVTVRPGNWPLRALAEAFAAIPPDAGPAARDTYLDNEVAGFRQGDAAKLVRIIDDRLRKASEKPDRLLLYIDQWEELYAMAPGAEAPIDQRNQHAADVERFIALLLAAANDPRSRTTVVLTVRADFYGPLIRHPALSALLPQRQVNIGPMSEDDLRAAIVTPATKVGLRFDPTEVVKTILGDVGTDEGNLPLLEYALKETWARREDDRLTAAGYTAAGRVQDAIQATAERIYERLTPADQEAARRLFLRLVTPGEGHEDTRARSFMPVDPVQRRIVQDFADPKVRLLVTGLAALPATGPASPASTAAPRATVEVAHEALIRNWGTLRGWLSGSRDKLRARAAILQQQQLWEENERRPDLLLQPGFQLERGRALLADPGDVTVEDVADYIRLSEAKDRADAQARDDAKLAKERQVAEAERLAREAAEQARAEAEKRTAIEQDARVAAEVARSRLSRWVKGAVTIALVALIAGGVAGWEWTQARHSAEESKRSAEEAMTQQHNAEQAATKACGTNQSGTARAILHIYSS